MRVRGWSRVLYFLVFCFGSVLLAPQAYAQLGTGKTITIGTDLYNGMLRASDGNFYTSTKGLVGCADNDNNNCAAIYQVTPTGSISVLHQFQESDGNSNANVNADGLAPTSLIEGADGFLYGTCAYGGPAGTGTIFKISLAGAFTLLYSFGAPHGVNASPQALIQGTDGNLYGVAPDAADDGQTTGGLFFRITTGGVFTPLHYFSEGSDRSEGYNSTSLVQGDDGNFYVTMSIGPVSTPGSIDKLTPAGEVSVWYNFDANNSEGDVPEGPLVEGKDSYLYGVTQSSRSAPHDYGYAFKVNASGDFQVLHEFTGGSDGGLPQYPLYLASDGNFYGTAVYGGDLESCLGYGCGLVFQLTSSGTLDPVWDFKGGEATSTIVADNPQVFGAAPQAPIAQGTGGVFYGTTDGGGSLASPTIYDLTMKTPIPAPIQLTFSPESVIAGKETTLTWKVLNAFSKTAQFCSGHVSPNPASADSRGVWNGKVQAGKLVEGVYTGSMIIAPTAAGTYTFALTCGGQESGFGTLKVPGPSLQIQTTALPVGSVGKKYQTSVNADGGEEPYHWSIQGALPKGLSFDVSSGSLYGTPLQYGKFPLLISVVDSEIPLQQASISLILTVQNTLKLSGTYPKAKYQVPYSGGLTLTGGVPPYQWKVVSSGISNSLPKGFTLNTSTGVISGSSQSTSGQFYLTIQVTDSENPKAELTQEELFTILPPDLKITSDVFLPSALQGKYYATALTATGGVPPYTWSVQAKHPLPPGLTLSTTGVLSGVPTEWSGEGYDMLWVTVTDSADPPISVYGYPDLHIDTDLKITLENLPTARVGEVYSVALTATGGVAPLKWTLSYSTPFPGTIALVPPSVPDGVWLLEATLTDADNAVVTLTVSDSEKPAASKTVVYDFIVLPALLPTTTTLASSNTSPVTGESVTFTATAASRKSGAPAPTGQMIFSSSGATLGTVALNAKGNASLTTSFAHTGVYSITATYSGSSTYAASTSAAVTEMVVNPKSSAAISPNNLTSASGSSRPP